MSVQGNILVTGSEGQLGTALRSMASAYPEFRFTFVSRNELPIDDAVAVRGFFDKHSFEYCINCAAYTAVDKAESEPEKAMLVNGTAVGNLAAACAKNSTLFIHISTDYVFNGTSDLPYKEDHPVDPINTYGASKLKGERLALEMNPGSIIIRTSWVYAAYGNNFVRTMLRLMKERESINVVSDQLGSPTYAPDLAAAIMQIIRKHAGGFVSNDTAPAIYHYSNQGVITWFDFAVAIRDLSGSNCIVNPIPTEQYPTPAKRPRYSVMDTNKIRNVYGIGIPGWKESLQQCLSLTA